MANLIDVYHELQNNPEFHEKFKKNPEQALLDAGFELNSTDLAKIKAMVNLDASQNEKLDGRMSK